MAFLPLAAAAASTALGAYGAIANSQAESGAAKYNSQVSLNNQTQANANAALSGQAGAEQTAIQSLKTRSEMGEVRANTAASGVDVNQGSAADVSTSQRELGELDAYQVRSNAVKEAYGYKTQAVNFGNEASLDKTEASNDSTAGYLNAGSTLLGGIGKAAENYQKYKLAGGFSG